jgi:hypothetical protein
VPCRSECKTYMTERGPGGGQVRYERRAGADTAVKVMTDGILLRELQARPRARAPARSGLGSSR